MLDLNFFGVIIVFHDVSDEAVAFSHGHVRGGQVETLALIGINLINKLIGYVVQLLIENSAANEDNQHLADGNLSYDADMFLDLFAVSFPQVDTLGSAALSMDVLLQDALEQG